MWSISTAMPRPFRSPPPLRKWKHGRRARFEDLERRLLLSNSGVFNETITTKEFEQQAGWVDYGPFTIAESLVYTGYGVSASDGEQFVDMSFQGNSSDEVVVPSTPGTYSCNSLSDLPKISYLPAYAPNGSSSITVAVAGSDPPELQISGVFSAVTSGVDGFTPYVSTINGSFSATLAITLTGKFTNSFPARVVATGQLTPTLELTNNELMAESGSETVDYYPSNKRISLGLTVGAGAPLMSGI